MSFPRYPAYKPSGVEWLGEVPEHWEALRLRFVATLNPSKQEAREQGNKKVVSFLPMEAIGEDGSLRLEQEKEISECLSGYTYFRDGDVCIAKITPCFENGKGAILRELKGGIGFGTTELIVARPDNKKITSEFLDYVFRSQTFRRLGESEMYGAGGQKRVPDSFVSDFTAILPSIEEQSQIATFLDRETAKIDALIAEQQRLIELLQEKRQAVISHAVTKGMNPDAPMKDSGVEWLGEVPEHWEVKPLKYLVTLASGGTPSKENLAYWDGSIPWASSKDLKADELFDTQDHISQKAIDDGAATLIPAGSILTVVRGMILRHTFPVAITRVPMAINQDLKVIRPSGQVTSVYLAWLLSGSSGEVLSRVDEAGHGTKVLRIDWWLTMMVPVPPVAEQKLIAESLIKHLQEIVALTDEAHRGVSVLQERRSALISAAVTGQIDVRCFVDMKGAKS